MAEQIFDLAYQILQSDEDYYLSLKKLWKIVYEKGSNLDFLSLEEFESQLRKDSRFAFLERKKDEDEEENEEIGAELEEFGDYGALMVGLVDRRPTAEDLERLLKKKLENIISSLQKAYEARPKDDPDVEDQLLQLMIKAKNLKEKIEKPFDKKEEDSEGTMEESRT